MFRIICRTIFALTLCLALTSSARAAIYSFNASFMNLGNPTTAPFRMWLPNDENGPIGATKPVRGLVFVLPGAGDNWLNKAQNDNFQKAATALGFGIVSADSMWWGGGSEETRDIVESVLAAAANVSLRPELVNAPLATMGVSQGGYNSIKIAAAVPERTIGFANIRGGYVVSPTGPNDPMLEVPGLNIAASQDNIVHPGGIHDGWQGWRFLDAPHAYAMELDTTHFDTHKGQSWEAAWYWLGESARLRYPNSSLLSTIPGVVPQLSSVDTSTGWLGHAPDVTYTDTLEELEDLVPTPNVEIAAISSGTFSEPALSASWLPNKGAAQVYRAFTSHDGISRGFLPRQGPLHFMSPVITDNSTLVTPLYEVGQTASFETQVHPIDFFRNGIKLKNVDFYFGSTYLGNVVATNNWTINVTFTQPGIHALTAIGYDAAGNEYPAFHTVLVTGVVPEPTSVMLIAFSLAALFVRERK
jgi:hypothetical protein